MKYKLSESKILQKIKDNKFKISLISGTLAAVLGISLGLGYAYNINAGNNTFGSGNPGGNAGGLPDGYVPEINVVPGEIKFDPNGKLLIPELVDEENPEGNYENKIDYTVEIEANEKADVININSEEFNKELDKSAHNVKAMINSYFPDEYFEKNLIISGNLASLVAYYLPNNSFVENEIVSFDSFINSIFDDAVELNKNSPTSMQNTTDLLALSGVNFDREYNKIISEANSGMENSVSAESNNKQVKGGGGAGAPPTIPPTLPSVTLPSDETPSDDSRAKITFMDEKNKIIDDQKIRVIIEIVYSALSLAISLASLAAAILTFGWSIILAIVDLVLCAYAVFQAVIEFQQNTEIMKIFDALEKYDDIATDGYDVLKWNFDYFSAANFVTGKYKQLRAAREQARTLKNKTLEVFNFRENSAKILKGYLSILSAGLYALKSILDIILGNSNEFFVWLSEGLDSLWDQYNKNNI